jgi:hypothetical protein
MVSINLRISVDAVGLTIRRYVKFASAQNPKLVQRAGKISPIAIES